MKANALALSLFALSVNSYASSTPTLDATNSASLENSEICMKFGGQSYTLESTNSGGYRDFCRIGDGPNWGDGALVGEKTLAMLAAGETSLAAAAFLRHESFIQHAGNPSYYYCKQLGGQTINYITIFNGRTLGETGFCTFSDGSMIGGWTLFRHHEKLEAIFQGASS